MRVPVIVVVAAAAAPLKWPTDLNSIGEASGRNRIRQLAPSANTFDSAYLRLIIWHAHTSSKATARVSELRASLLLALEAEVRSIGSISQSARASRSAGR